MDAELKILLVSCYFFFEISALFIFTLQTFLFKRTIADVKIIVPYFSEFIKLLSDSYDIFASNASEFLTGAAISGC